MLVIRDGQMRAMEEAQFLGWLRKHLQRFFPERCVEVGELQLARIIAEGVHRAHEYGFRAPPDVCRFLDFMFAFGVDFDRDESLPWASELLHALEITDPAERMDLLVVEAKAHLARSAVEGVAS